MAPIRIHYTAMARRLIDLRAWVGRSRSSRTGLPGEEGRVAAGRGGSVAAAWQRRSVCLCVCFGRGPPDGASPLTDVAVLLVFQVRTSSTGLLSGF